MKFRTTCYIRKDTKELREKLSEMGYKVLNEEPIDGLVADKALAYPIKENNLIKETINCGDDEELFIKLASERTEDAIDSSKINLCDSCSFHFTTCLNTDIKFGNGIGNDNVIKCDGYVMKRESEVYTNQLLRRNG